MSVRKRNRRLNDAFEIGLYAICGFCIVYYTVRGVYSKSFQALLIISVLLLIRGLVKWTKTKWFPALRFSVLFFITVAMLLAIRKMIQNQDMTRFPSRIGIWFGWSILFVEPWVP